MYPDRRSSSSDQVQSAMHAADPEPPRILDLPATSGSPPTDRAVRGTRALPLALAVVVILGGSALFLSGYSLGRQTAIQPGTPAFEQGAFVPFWDTYDTINEQYAGGEISRDALIQGAIRGMIEALGDPYSSYMTSDEYRQSLQGISGRFEGIGAEIATRASDGSEGCLTLGPDCRLMVTEPLEGSPAARAGLLAGDLVLEADGVSLDGLTIDGARDRIRGPKGSVVTLTVVRDGGEPFALAITRDFVQSREVVSEALAGGSVGYVLVKGFSDSAAEQLEEALVAHLQAGRTELILDLRGDPGGHVTAARTIASQFIGSGVIFWEQDADGHQDATEALPGGVATDPDLRIICLIDGGSASASEIVAGALQDTGRATLVGQTSFGKGTVQRWQELSGEGGAFRLTIARWLTPDKRWIHDVGLTPDVVVSVPDPLPAGADPTLDRALELLAEEALLPASGKAA
jgi:carboxyl-terminal processing protease